jgi:hypothetical protein
VGAILLAPILTKAVGLPGFVFREGYWTPRNQLAGPFIPNKNQRVLLIYDLMVSGGGVTPPKYLTRILACRRLARWS